VKKYLVVLIPFLVTALLSLYFAISDPNLNAAYGRDYIYDYLSQAWLAIGLIVSALVFFVLLIFDIFAFVERAAKKRALKR